MDNKAIADELLKGKRKSVLVANLKHATAIRVAAHRLGGVLTVKAEKRRFRLIKSTAKIRHRKQQAKRPAARRR